MPLNDYDDSKYYSIPVEELGLSNDTLALVKSTGITSIGDYLDYFLRGHDAMITAPGAFIKAMETVVKEHLMQYGYPLDGTEIE